MGSKRLNPRHWLAILAVAGALGACADMRPVIPSASGALPAQGAAAGPFAVRRIELQFEDGRAERTVARGGTVTARAIVQTQGTGVLRGAWLANGQPVGTFALTVNAGATVTIGSGAATPLPTVVPGPHTLSLRIDEPAITLAAPVIHYLVTAEEASHAPR